MSLPTSAAAARPNVFAAGLLSGDEDRFTAYWHVVLDWYPALAQRVVDHIAERARIPTSAFITAEDHPLYTAADRPDFRLRCEAYDLVCEHKLDAALGPRQLERYCALVGQDSPTAGATPAGGASGSPGDDRRAYVVLITTAPTEVPDAVLADPAYLRPADGTVPHFRWEDFYPLVRSFAVASGPDGRLARDFADFMAVRGLAPWQWGPWGDPFVEGSSAAEQFRRLWPALVPRYRENGRVVRQDSVGLGLQWLRPFPTVPSLSLVHIAPVPALDPPDPRLPSRAIRFRVWQLEDAVRHGGALPDADGVVAPAAPGGPGAIFVRTRRGGRGDDRVTGAILVREYATSLAAVLADDQTEARERLHAFVAVCAADLARAPNGAASDVVVDRPPASRSTEYGA